MLGVGARTVRGPGPGQAAGERRSRRSPPHRFQRRLGLLHALEHSGFERTGGADRVKDHTSLYRQTAGMVLSPRMKAFDSRRGPHSVRAAYGTTPFGQGCLLARRLVQAGVTFIEVRSGGWDTHQQNHERVAKLAGESTPASPRWSPT